MTKNSFPSLRTLRQDRALHQILGQVLGVAAFHCRVYIARRAPFVSIVKSATRNLSTLLPWRFAVSIAVIIVPRRLQPALVRQP
jgi:hypothetical protein